MNFSEAVEILRDRVVRSCLGEIAEEVGVGIEVAIRMKIGHEIIAINDLVCCKQFLPLKRGEFRIVTPPFTGGDTLSFSGECILNDVSQGTGFSGLSIRGKIKLLENSPAVQMLARTNRYNVWDWGAPFRFED